MQKTTDRKVLVTGATGFIGRALVPALRARGVPVVAATRRPMGSTVDAAGVEWRTCDLLRPETLSGALKDIKVAYYLVHSMGGGNADFRELERRAARPLGSSISSISSMSAASPPGLAQDSSR